MLHFCMVCISSCFALFSENGSDRYSESSGFKWVIFRFQAKKHFRFFRIEFEALGLPSMRSYPFANGFDFIETSWESFGVEENRNQIRRSANWDEKLRWKSSWKPTININFMELMHKPTKDHENMFVMCVCFFVEFGSSFQGFGFLCDIFFFCT